MRARGSRRAPFAGGGRRSRARAPGAGARLGVVGERRPSRPRGRLALLGRRPRRRPPRARPQTRQSIRRLLPTPPRVAVGAGVHAAQARRAHAALLPRVPAGALPRRGGARHVRGRARGGGRRRPRSAAAARRRARHGIHLHLPRAGGVQRFFASARGADGAPKGARAGRELPGCVLSGGGGGECHARNARATLSGACAHARRRARETSPPLALATLVPLCARQKEGRILSWGLCGRQSPRAHPRRNHA
mmetsp:Transcript_16164/g.52842  ORF Transcript_16164/g.52842 Transcript_16164/m.52842 type:complete len:249 (-) Transcript_16164:907-1653(-)